MKGNTLSARAVRSLEEALAVSGLRDFVLGGAIRDAVILGPTAIPKDIDVVVDGPLDELWANWGFWPVGYNAFGSPRVVVNGVLFDLWTLKNSWAFQCGLVGSPTFENLPKTTPLNIQAVCVELGGPEHYEAGFQDCLLPTTIDANLQPFPCRNAVLQKAQLLASRFGFKLGGRLQCLLRNTSLSTD